MFQTDKLKGVLIFLKRTPYAVPILLAILGVCLLLVFSNDGKQAKTKSSLSEDPNEYVDRLEKELEESINGFSSVESCSIMITLSSLESNEYLENSSVSSSSGNNGEQYDRQSEYLVIDQDGNDSVIIENRNTPQIRGVLIVYKGAGDVETQKNILDAATTVLGVKSNKVCVVAY